MCADTLGCMYVDFGCMPMEPLGAKYALETFGCMYADFGCKSMERLGAKYAVVGCQVCGCWVQVYGAVGCMPDSR